MATFAAYGISIESPVDLGLREVREDPRYVFRVRSGPFPDKESVVWVPSALGGQENWMRTGRLADAVLIHVEGCVDFEICGRHVLGWIHDGCDSDTLRHLLVNQLLPRLLARDGHLVLHAGSVEIAGKALCFLGESGSGKSSLTAAFAQQGVPILTDDCLVLDDHSDPPLAIPSHEEIRLWAHSAAEIAPRAATRRVADYTGKLRLDVGGFRFAEDPVPIGLVVQLDPAVSPDEPCLELLTPRDGMLALLKSRFALVPPTGAESAALLDRLIQLATRRPVHRLTYPRDLSRIGEVVEMLSAGS